MTRSDFLTLFGLGVAAACTGCLSACRKESAAVPAPTTVDFTLDLTAPANAALTRNGGYLYREGVIIGRVDATTYLAVSQYCTHAGTSVQFQAASNRFYCPNHGAAFAPDGAVWQQPDEGRATPLKAYTVTLLPADQLRVQG